jgi:hypothetical protein
MIHFITPYLVSHESPREPRPRTLPSTRTCGLCIFEHRRPGPCIFFFADTLNVNTTRFLPRLNPITEIVQVIYTYVRFTSFFTRPRSLPTPRLASYLHHRHLIAFIEASLIEERELQRHFFSCHTLTRTWQNLHPAQAKIRNWQPPT